MKGLICQPLLSVVKPAKVKGGPQYHGGSVYWEPHAADPPDMVVSNHTVYRKEKRREKGKRERKKEITKEREER